MSWYSTRERGLEYLPIFTFVRPDNWSLSEAAQVWLDICPASFYHEIRTDSTKVVMNLMWRSCSAGLYSWSSSSDFPSSCSSSSCKVDIQHRSAHLSPFYIVKAMIENKWNSSTDREQVFPERRPLCCLVFRIARAAILSQSYDC